MKIVIIGGVAAGTKAAAKLKRENRSAEVEIYTKSKDISYAGCGLPYYVGGGIKTREALVVNSPTKFMGLTGVKVFNEHEAVAVDPQNQTVSVRDLSTQKEKTVSYDKLIIATGANPFIPPIEGIHLQGVFSVRQPDDAVSIRNYVQERAVQEAVVIGAGFIGMEMAENLRAQCVKVTVVDMMNQILPNVFDPGMAVYAKQHLEKEGYLFKTETAVQSLLPGEGESSNQVAAVMTDHGKLAAQLVILCIGVKPATEFLANCGLEMIKGAIVVDEWMGTNIENLYAVGDCALVQNRVTGVRQWSAMGSTANICGRALAKSIMGRPSPYLGCLGTGVVKLSDTFNAGRTGLSEAQAKAAGWDYETAVCVSDDKAHYYPGSGHFVTKVIADKKTKRLLGIQVFGKGAVDKMTDIAVVGISMSMTLSDFEMLDFAYAPPFSTAIHPFVQACGVLENKIDGIIQSFSPVEYMAGAADDYTLVDVQATPTIPGAVWMDLNHAEEEILKFPKEAKLLLVCTRGKRAYMFQNRIRALGYQNTRCLEGGVAVNPIREASRK